MSGTHDATMRRPTLETLGLGTVLDIFRRGRPPAEAGDLVDEVFGPGPRRGSLVISGAGGIVGAGKAMQLGSRLHRYGVPLVALDLAGAPDGIGRHYPGLVRAFGEEEAAAILSNIVRMSYDGRRLPPLLAELRPRFLLEAIPERLELKRAHYALVREAFPEIEIRSVTSGFPASELGVGIAHPAFPHEVNKVWEIVEDEPSAVTRLFWALGLVPVPVADRWSFILDVLFTGLTLAGLRYHRATNMPFWKVDKLIRRLLGPNPFRAHDAIGAAGANFLTWSCLHHLAERYGELFRPTPELEERKETGQSWYPPNHFRPVVGWDLAPEDDEVFRAWILGPLYQMTSLMLHEERGHLSHMNAIGELCAQFRRGILAVARGEGAEAVIRTVEAYHRLHPEAAGGAWYPDAFAAMDEPGWQQLYVNAEREGEVGVVTIGREGYGWEVDAELNRALDWLRARGVRRLIVTGDFHLATQMVGADTADFFPTLEDPEAGRGLAAAWSRTARRLHGEFEVSVGFVNGKRCLGGFLELLAHCTYLVAVADAEVGFPEVTLPVVPGVEGCHWPLRRARPEDRPRILELLLTGRTVPARETVGWLVDFAGPLDEALRAAWSLVTGRETGVAPRPLVEDPLRDPLPEVPPLPPAGSPGTEAAREAVVRCVREACGVPLCEALEVQARHAGDFLASTPCREGRVGAEYARTMRV